MKDYVVIAALVAGIAIFEPVGNTLAQGRGPGIQGAPGVHVLAQPQGAAQREMLTVMQQSHLRIMNQQMTGNPDRDFAEVLLQHAQATLDLARIELRYGKNARVREMATELIRTREREQQRTREMLAGIAH